MSTTGGEATIANAGFCRGAVFVHAPLSLLSAWDIARRRLHIKRHGLGRVESEAEQNKHNVRREHARKRYALRAGPWYCALTGEFVFSLFFVFAVVFLFFGLKAVIFSFSTQHHA